jgi:hypothetical protein
MYLYKRGKGAARRVMHLAIYNQGGSVIGAACRTKLTLNTSCNVPLRLRLCRKCSKVIYGQPKTQARSRAP